MVVRAAGVRIGISGVRIGVGVVKKVGIYSNVVWCKCSTSEKGKPGIYN